MDKEKESPNAKQPGSDATDSPTTVQEPKEKEPEWTDREARLIQHEAFIAKVLRQRSPSDEQKSDKPKWQRFLESTGGTALITVIIGGIFGAIISAMIQSSQKDREFQESWLRARGDQALVAYKDYLDKQQEILRRVYERIGACTAAADDLMGLTRPELVVTNYEGEQKERIRKYRTDVREKYNASERDWRNERDTLGLLMNYYNPGQDMVLGAWKNVSTDLTAYLDCASQWVEKHPISDEGENACKQEKRSFAAALESLTKSVEANRSYAWKGWESPGALKSALEKKP